MTRKKIKGTTCSVYCENYYPPTVYTVVMVYAWQLYPMV